MKRASSEVTFNVPVDFNVNRGVVSITPVSTQDSVFAVTQAKASKIAIGGEMKYENNNVQSETPKSTSRTNLENASNVSEENNTEQRDDEVVKLMFMLLDGADVAQVDNRYYKKLVQKLKQYSKQQIEHHNSEEVAIACSIIKQIQNRETKILKKSALKQFRGQLNERLKSALSKVESVNNSIEKTTAEMKKRFEKQLEDLDKKHAKEKEDFIKLWHSPKKIRQFNRPSSELIHQRAQAKKMVEMGIFDKIDITDREVFNTTVRDLRRNQRAMEDKYAEEYIRLEKKQAKEKQMMEIKFAEKLNTAQALWKHDLDVAQLRVDCVKKELSNAKDPDVVWNRYYRGESMKISRQQTPKTSISRPRSVTSHSTVSKLSLPPLPSPRALSSRRRLRPIE